MLTSEYADKYQPFGPNPTDIDRPDAHRALTAADGVGTMPSFVGEMAPAQPGADEGRCLWVIVPDALPMSLESAERVTPPPLSLGKVKHSNLTGGGPASCGGEIWLDAVDPKLLHLNGASGRFTATSPGQLEDAVRVFEAFDFSVRSAGWDEDLNRPARRFREP